MDAVNQKQAADLKQLETYLDEIEDNMLDLEGCLVDLLAMESDIRGRRTVMLENIAKRDAAEGIDAFIEKRPPVWTGE